MKTLVVYFSQTGNTEKLARAIYDEIHTEKDIKPLPEVADIGQYDVIFCGFPVQSHSVPPPVAQFIKTIPDGKRLAIFSTHGSLRGGQLAVTALEQAMTLAKHVKILGTFGCRGKVSQKVLDALMNKPEHKAWAVEAQGASRHPDQADLEDAKAFARDAMSRASGG